MEQFVQSFEQVTTAIGLFLYLTYPILLPLLLLYGFWQLWVTYVRSKFIEDTKEQVLEIKVPREVKRTPLAMELVLNALYQTGGESTWYDRYVLGKVRSWFSLEIVSIGGNVRFFIWTPAKWKNLIESQLYAEYPGIEVFESPDYAKFVSFDESKMDYWGCEFVFSEPDYLPLKTYMDYGMDKQAGMKDEDKVDPLLPTIEFMSTLSRKEQFWIQIVIRAHKGRSKAGAGFLGILPGKEKWQDTGKKAIKETTEAESSGAEGAPQFKGRLLNKSEEQYVEAINRNISKYGFDTGVRALYMGEKEAFQGANIPGFIGSFRQFGANNLNSLRPNNVTDFDYPWIKELRKKKLSEMKEKMLKAYKRRQFFHAPFIRKHQVLNAEQLATLYHFPSGIVETPALSRVQSRKAEPPTNLPT
ncbi:MAG: hypothetical protein U5L75_01970 [Candidatus Campbellbacteria bacterium]|nr:hypothetical protein [Candidatus Campbellbacteria bacterium]